MTEVERIMDQLKRAFDGEAWHGPAVREALDGVDADKAAVRSIPGAHSIWDIVRHIGAWKDAVRRRLAGDPAQLSPQEDWPAAMETSEEAWQQTLERLKESHRRLLDAVSALDDARLDSPVVEGLSSVYFTLHGVIQHDVYHAGQIMLLKKERS